VFTANPIEKLVELLRRRGATLWHACQFQDFVSYLEIGGIPSRELLEQRGQEFTPFDTDSRDKENGVWDKVFINLADFGDGFAKDSKCTPNAFGPIALEVAPGALLDGVTDVAICLRSAGALGFCRDKAALGSLKEVELLFYDELSPDLRFAKDLKEIFPSAAMQPEVSCTIPAGFIPMRYVDEVHVDPYKFGKKSLLFHVEEQIDEHGYGDHGDQDHLRATERWAKGGRRRLYKELLDVLLTDVPSLSELMTDSSRSPLFLEWCRDIGESGLGWQFRRYAKYLRAGTILPLKD
ncbi:uncharacterized protein METZ01_LOCUS249890, partial [marine metagenome]